MATLEQISRLVDAKGPLWQKFRGAVIKTAAYVYQTEAPETENHANRVLWAQDVLLAGNVDQRTAELYLLGMTNDQIVTSGDSANDSDVEWVVSFFLNSVATGE